MDNKVQEMLADKFTKRFEDYNTKVLEEIAEVISQFKELTPTEAHKLAQQLKYNKSYIDLIDELAKLTGKSKKEIKGLLEEVAEQNIEFSEVFYKAKGLEVPIYKENKTLQNIVNSIVNVAGDEFVNIARSTGFMLLDESKHIQFYNIKETFYKVIDECVYAVETGQESFNETMRSTIKQLSDSGVKYVIYKNDGKQQSIQRVDSVVRRNILDSIRQTTIATNEELGEKFGYDGWEVTVHSNPAPDHENVQGHRFTKDEFEKFQNDKNCVDVNGVEFKAKSEETGRDRRSIGQYNCYHTAFPILIDVDKPLYSDEELQKIIDENNKEIEIDGKKYTKYEATQLQRQLETEIRKHKDTHIMYRKVNDEDGMLREQKKITQLKNKYKEISKKSNLREQMNRTIVEGYRPSKIPEKAKKIYYHTSNSNFNEFDNEAPRRAILGGQWGYGHYFFDNKEMSDDYGAFSKYQYEAEVNDKLKWFEVSDKEFTQKLRDMGYKPASDDIAKFLQKKGYGGSIIEHLKLNGDKWYEYVVYDRKNIKIIKKRKIN